MKAGRLRLASVLDDGSGSQRKFPVLKDGLFDKLRVKGSLPDLSSESIKKAMESSPLYRVLVWMLQSQEQLVQTILFPPKKTGKD